MGINVKVAVNGVQGVQKAEVVQGSKPVQEMLVNHDEDVLIDSETSFFDLLERLRRSPEAIAAEKEEREQKEEEEREAKLREALGEDYEVYTAQEGMNNKEAFKKADRRPGPVQLWNRYHRIAVKEIGEKGRCEVYENGYGVYDNGDRRTVVWVPDCGSTTYYFAPLRDNEKEYQTQQQILNEDVFGPIPWYHAVTVAGEDSIERNLIHPKSVGTTSEFDQADTNTKPDYSWRCGGHIETPEEAFFKKENERERLSVLTPKQKEVYLLRYREGYNEAEIGNLLGLSRSAVRDRLECIWDKLGKDREKFF